MFLKIVIGALVVLALFLIFISTREGKFNYEVSETIKAPAAKIFPYLSDLKMGEKWSPYDRPDSGMKKEFEGPGNTVGSKMKFEGDRDTGSGSIEILNIVPNELVELRLIMTAPFKADNLVQYRLTPKGDGTRFTWAMSGDGGYFGKLLNFFVDCEKMVTDQFRQGMTNLKTAVETLGGKMHLTDTPEEVTWAPFHYVFVEKVGPFQETAMASWKELHSKIEELKKNSKILGQMALYQVQPQMIYRAGAMVSEKPGKVPAGLKYERVPGGKYSRFTMTGSYSNLPEVSGIVHGNIEKLKIPVRKDFFIENYTNDPAVTPEDELKTEILIPIK